MRRTLLARTPLRKAARLSSVLLIASTAACWNDLDDPQVTICPHGAGNCQGVYTWCDNYGGGGDDGADANRNYWWENVPISTGQCLVGEEIHCLDGSAGTTNCYCKKYSKPAHQGDMGVVCVGEGNPGDGAHPWNDWLSKVIGGGDTGGTGGGGAPGHYPIADADIRDWCSNECLGSNQIGAPDPRCDDARWNGHHTFDWHTGANDLNCKMPVALNQDDPDGSDVPWSLVGGPSTPVPLHCNLDDGSCSDLFYPSVAAFVLYAGSADLIEPETRRADYLGVDVSPDTELTLSPQWGPSDTQPLAGMAEYSTIDCLDPAGGPADVCPFFLANLSASNVTTSWEVAVETTEGTYTKEIKNVHIDLLQSTLGIHHEGLNQVAFAPGALQMRVAYEIDGSESIGNGTHVSVVENDGYVFAEYRSGGWMHLSTTFRFQSGSAELTVAVEPGEHPPVASHDLTAVEECDVLETSPPGGLLLDENRSLSSDQDFDIAREIWWVDGEPCAHGCIVPIGSHSVSLEVHDERGAVRRTPDLAVEVTYGPVCIPME